MSFTLAPRARTAVATRSATAAASETSAEGVPQNEVFTFGKHAGRRFEEVWQREKGYVRWITGLEQASGAARKFQEYVRFRESGGVVAPGGSSGASSSSFQGPGHTLAVSPSATPAPDAPPLTLSIQKKWLDLIKAGRKIFEGRIANPALAALKPGDRLAFASTGSGSSREIFSVRRVLQFASFRSMLETCGVEQCLPGCQNVEEGERIYHSFPNFAALAARKGVLAVELGEVQEQADVLKGQACHNGSAAVAPPVQRSSKAVESVDLGPASNSLVSTRGESAGPEVIELSSDDGSEDSAQQGSSPHSKKRRLL